MAYIGIPDLRAEGVMDPPFSNAHLTERIALACQSWEYITGMFFEEKVGHVVTVDGSGNDTLALPYPPKTTSAITLIEIGDHATDGTTWTEVDTGPWEVVMPTNPDGRFRPQVLHLTSAVWPKGKRNVRLTGTFGFVDPDGSVPGFVKDVVKRIAMWQMPKIGDAAAQHDDRIIEEQLKDYRYKLSEPTSVRAGMFGDPRIEYWASMFHGIRVAAV